MILPYLQVLGQERFPMFINDKFGRSIRYVYDINVDSNGLLWLVSESGLSSYDGSSFKFYLNENMGSKEGTGIVIDGQNNVWYNNFDGEIFKVENDSLKIMELPRNQAVNFSIVKDTLYFVHASHFCKYSLKTQKLERVFKAPQVHFIRFQGQNVIFIDPSGLHFTIFDFEGNIKHEFQLDEKFESNIVPYNNEWYGVKNTGKSIEVYALSIANKPPLVSIPLDAVVNNIIVQGANMSICTQRGVIQLDLGTLRWTFKALDINALSRFTDPFNNEWVGTYNGLVQYSSHFIANRISLPKGVYDFIPMGNNLFVFERNGAVYRFDFEFNHLEQILQMSTPHRVYQVIDQQSPHTMHSLLHYHRTRKEHTFIFQDVNYLILNSGTKGIQRLDEKYLAMALSGACDLVKVDNPKDSLVSLWDKQFYKYLQSSENTVSAQLIRQVRGKAVAYDSLGKRLLFASNLGLQLFTPDTSFPIYYQGKPIFGKSLSQIGATFIMLSHGGDLYQIGSDNQVARLSNLSSNTPIVDFRISGNRVLFWNSNNIYINELKDINEHTKYSEWLTILCPVAPADIKDLFFNEDKVVLVYGHELLTIDISTLQRKDKDFRFAWIGAWIDNAAFLTDSFIEISSKQLNVNFLFSLIDYNHEVYHIEYQLNDEDWKPLAPTDRKISFSSISAGEYRIRLRINGFVQESSILFIKLKPWYNQYWFYGIILISVVGILIYYFKFRLKRQAESNKLLLEKNSLEYSLRQSLLSSIKSQMNPHFLFNALNTIQSYIVTEDKENASRYLSLYAKLTRTILEMSDKEYVTLDAEIKAVSLYTHLERMRFPEIQYNLELDPSINTLTAYIPSMIIQPFVENAIKHGLLHSQKEKKLTITILKEEEVLMINISDNGIGRKQSTILNEKRNKGHSSFATRANIKRLELLNLGKNDIVWEYQDLYDDIGQALGTEVLLKIPIKYLKND